MLTGKRAQPDESAGWEKSYAAKKFPKTAIPSSFPDPHTYQEVMRHPWEQEFEEYSSEIRLKPDWLKKVFDEEILAKWKSEIPQKYLWSRLKAEIQYLASLASPDADPSSVDQVWIKDSVIPESLHKKFVDLVASRLENKEKEFHPSSNNTVVDLVHPSLHCYVHGSTRVLEEQNHSQLSNLDEWKSFLTSGTPETNPTLEESVNVITTAKKIQSGIQIEEESDEDSGEDCYERSLKLNPSLLFRPHTPVDDEDPDEYDVKINQDKKNLANHLAGIYRWIPADVTVDMFGKVSFNSYINGLHPFEDKELYEVIAEIMNYFIPLWANVLADINHDPPPHAVNRLDLAPRKSHVLDGISRWQLDDDFAEELKKAKNMAGNSFDEETFEVDLCNKFETPVRHPPIDLTRSQLKVIVKIASCELTPENPVYTGSWHIEGVPEESILSTGIYYFDEENIADNFLSFRVAHDDPQYTNMQCPMGLGFGAIMNRDTGKVQTKQGRLIAFPNIMQHCLKTVTLRDESKPGFRKILVFFLVDPNKQVLSSGRVPPPNKEWAEKEGVATESESFQSLEQARVNRENLMFTRKFYVVSQNENIFERECTFCEH